MRGNSGAPQPEDSVRSTIAKEQSILKTGRRRYSSSAQGALRWRAIESLRPNEERICYDSVAGALMGPFWTCMARNRFIKKRLIKQLDRQDTGMANWILARTRYIDDYLQAQIEEGIKQLVILGAGYDTRAYRLHGLEEQMKVFELDDLATQKFKIAKVKIALRSFPKNIVYVAIDFDREKLETKLTQRIYDRSLKTLFIWEGVSMYLTSAAVDQTLAFVTSNSGKGSSIVFDYLFRSAVDGHSDLREVKKLQSYCAQIGEPLLFGIDEDRVEQFLSNRGFDLVQNLTAKSLKDAYFKGKGEQRKIFPLVAISSARVRYR